MRTNLLPGEEKVKVTNKMSWECLIVTNGGNALKLFNDIKCQYDAIGCPLDLIFFFLFLGCIKNLLLCVFS